MKTLVKLPCINFVRLAFGEKDIIKQFRINEIPIYKIIEMVDLVNKAPLMATNYSFEHGTMTQWVEEIPNDTIRIINQYEYRMMKKHDKEGIRK